MALNISLHVKKDTSIYPNGKLKAHTETYTVFGTLDGMEALLAVAETAPAEYHGFVQTELRLIEQTPQYIEIQVTYGANKTSGGSSSDKDEDDALEVNFDCSTGSIHITHGLSEKVWKGESAGGAIGWNGKYGDDMEITGVDVPIAQCRKSFTKYMDASEVNSAAFDKKINNLTAKVNSKSFKGYDAGEVMFLGCTYTAKEGSDEKVAVTFNFQIQPNESKVVGDTQVAKEGFEHCWANSETVAEKGKTPKIVTKGVYTNKVVNSADFGQLGLGR
ncbi:MAG: hypothetical protein IKB77_04630 [Lentisphaeria bacterium]|nr:hypothetical protein [Lentisphaeria bacterium]